MSEPEIKSKIEHRRRQILVHSCLYYRMDKSIIDDAKFDRWALELAALQNTYPEIASRCAYANDFNGFDGSTGFNLPSIYQPEIIMKASQLLDYKG